MISARLARVAGTMKVLRCTVLGYTLLVAACKPMPLQGTEAASTESPSPAAGTKSSSLAATGPVVVVPKLTGRVNDYANLLTPTEESELSKMYESLEQELGCQIAALTIDSLETATIEEYSLRVTNAWGLGRRGVDDGILVTLALKEKSVRIEVGLGLELIISDDVAQEIISHMTPDFASGNFFKGLNQGSLELIQKLKGNRDLVGKRKP